MRKKIAFLSFLFVLTINFVSDQLLFGGTLFIRKNVTTPQSILNVLNSTSIDTAKKGNVVFRYNYYVRKDKSLSGISASLIQRTSSVNDGNRVVIDYRKFLKILNY